MAANAVNDVNRDRVLVKYQSVSSNFPLQVSMSHIFKVSPRSSPQNIEHRNAKVAEDGTFSPCPV